MRSGLFFLFAAVAVFQTQAQSPQPSPALVTAPPVQESDSPNAFGEEWKTAVEKKRDWGDQVAGSDHEITRILQLGRAGVCSPGIGEAIDREMSAHAVYGNALSRYYQKWIDARQQQYDAFKADIEAPPNDDQLPLEAKIAQTAKVLEDHRKDLKNHQDIRDEIKRRDGDTAAIEVVILSDQANIAADESSLKILHDQDDDQRQELLSRLQKLEEAKTAQRNSQTEASKQRRQYTNSKKTFGDQCDAFNRPQPQ